MNIKYIFFGRSITPESPVRSCYIFFFIVLIIVRRIIKCKKELIILSRKTVGPSINIKLYYVSYFKVYDNYVNILI